MAIILPGAPGGEARGKVGGVVFSRNSYGAYVRERVNPINPNSDRQISQRLIMKNLSQRWANDLGQSQRDSWNEFAAQITVKNSLGLDIHLSGFNHYIRQNSVLQQALVAIVDDPPAQMTLPEPPSNVSIYPTDDGAVSVGFANTDEWATTAGGKLFVWLGPAISRGRSYFSNRYRYMGIVNGATPVPPTTPQAMSSPWNLYPQYMQQRAYFRVWIPTKGLSEPTYATAAIDAAA